MAKISYAVVIILLAFSHFTISRAQDTEDSDLVFFSDPLSFNQSCEDLAFEDFEDTKAGPNTSVACTGPFNSMTDDNCYAQGALIPGFTLIAIPPGQISLVVITSPKFSLTKTAAGPEDPFDSTQIIFDPPQSGVGLSLVTPVYSGILTVEIYGPDNTFLGTTDLNMEQNNVGQFLGITAEEKISQIYINNNIQQVGELLYEIQFGDCGISLGSPGGPIIVPTLSEWGLLAMSGVLGIIGLLALRRRKVSA